VTHQKDGLRPDDPARQEPVHPRRSGRGRFPAAFRFRASPRLGTTAFQPPPRWLPYVPFALALLVYLPALGHGFVWDDVDFIAENPAAHRLADLPQSLAQGYGWVPGGAAAPDALRYYRPVVTLANSVTWAVSGGRPWLFHLENVVAHGGMAALVTLLAASLGLSAGAALLTGALFALHPSLCEPVAWISGRTDVFAGCFGLLALLLLIRWRRGRADGRTALWIAAGAMFLALGSKESALALVVPAALILAMPHAGRARPRLAWAAVVAPVLLFFLLRVSVLGAGGFQLSGSGSSAPRLWLSGNLFLAYLRQVIVPWPLVTEPPVSLLGGKAPVFAGVIGASLLAALTVVWLWMLQGWRSLGVTAQLRAAGPTNPPSAVSRLAAAASQLPAASFGLAIFLFGLLPVLQWIPTGEIYGERFLYLPLAGLCLTAAALGDSLFRRRPAWIWVMAVVLGSGWTVLIERRLPDWRNNTALSASAARIRPESARALANYGSALAADGHPEQGAPLLQRAVRLAPGDPLRHQQYGTLLLNTGKFAEASVELEKAYRAGLRSGALIKSLGVAWTRTERFSEAIMLLRQAMDADPSDPELPDALGMAERKLGQRDEAAAHFRRSIQLAPSRPGPWMNLIAMLAYESGDPAGAAAVGQEFLRRFPAAPEAETVRRILQGQTGRADAGLSPVRGR
jgi:protein O-mannosyl-transferase